VTEQANASVLNFLEQSQAELTQRIEHIFKNIPIPREVKTSVIWQWSLTLAALSLDVSRSVVHLVREGQLRSASILTRCLYEYWVRLRFYSNSPDDAIRDYENADNRTRATIAGYGREVIRQRVPSEKFAEIEQLLETKGKIQNRTFSEMLRNVIAPESYGIMYYTYYGIPSAFAHGNELAIQDVLSGPTEELRTEMRLHLHTPNVQVVELLLSTTQSLLHVLDNLSDIFGYRRDVTDLLRAEYTALVEREKLLDT
jgi:hypothetical protein